MGHLGRRVGPMTPRHNPPRRFYISFIASLAAALVLAFAASAQASAGLTDQVVLGFAADGYHYIQTSNGALAGFEDPSFNDTNWPVGTAAFGTGGCNFASAVRTYWSPFT